MKPIGLAALAFAALAVTGAGAAERALTAQEINSLLVGKAFRGQAASGAAKFLVEYRPDGKMEVAVNPDSQRPSQMSGTWSLKGDLLCRKLSDEKCQRIVEDGDRYYWLDQDGTRTSYAEKSALR